MQWLLRTLDLREDERRPFVFGFLSFFLIFVAWYMVRPVREAMGIARGADELPWLMLATVVVSFLVNPLFSKLTTARTRTQLARWVYRFLGLNLLAFFLVFAVFDDVLGIEGERLVHVGYAMYVWVSIFSLLNNSVLWSLASEQFRPSASKRLFGSFGAACSLGGIVGSFMVTRVSDAISANQAVAEGVAGAVGSAWLPAGVEVTYLLVPAALLMFAASWTAGGMVQGGQGKREDDRPALSGSAWESAQLVWRSPFLRGICGYILGYTVVRTFVYFMQGAIIDAFEASTAQDVGRFAYINMLTNGVTLVLQVFGTRALVKSLGVTAGLAVLPLFCALGMGVLYVIPTYAAIVAFQVGSSAIGYGLAKPAREMLFTVVTPNEKFKAKNLIDLFVYRSGDSLGSLAWIQLGRMKLGLSAMAAVTIPLCFGWFFLAPYLGREFDRRERAAVGEEGAA